MPQVGFEPTIPVLERAKTVHALDRAVTVIGRKVSYMGEIESVDFLDTNYIKGAKKINTVIF
jgi:hypothetical protein